MAYWEDSLLIGVTLIDDQHRKMVDMIDRLMSACKEGKGKTEVGKALSFTVNYVKEHFRDEESLQEKYAYPGINAHKRLHAQFAMTINALVQEFERVGPTVALVKKINNTLVEWLLQHISIEDKKIGEHIQKAVAK